MKIAVIGVGNMGRAIVAGIGRSPQAGQYDFVLGCHSQRSLDDARRMFPHAKCTLSNREAVSGAEIVIYAVKPWILPDVVGETAPAIDFSRQLLVSLAGGVSLDDFSAMFASSCTSPMTLHAIPNTALAVGESVTFISASGAVDDAGREAVTTLFSHLGEVIPVEEKLMNAATALSSCGIAYAYRYVQACVQAGVELGFRPAQALDIVVGTVRGAMAMLSAGPTSPSAEIDKVTTPGGMTIKGINELDHRGFTSAVIAAVKKPLGL